MKIFRFVCFILDYDVFDLCSCGKFYVDLFIFCNMEFIVKQYVVIFVVFDLLG